MSRAGLPVAEPARHLRRPSGGPGPLLELAGQVRVLMAGLRRGGAGAGSPVALGLVSSVIEWARPGRSSSSLPDDVARAAFEGILPTL